MIPGWTARYVGIPFKDCGRDFYGADCYGLVRLVLEHERGIMLPEYSVYKNADTEAEQLIMLLRPLFPAQKVEEPVDFDVILMWMAGNPVHLGIWAGGYVLHTLRRTGSVLHRADSTFFKGRTMEVYRVRE